MNADKEKLSYICSQFRIPGEILVYRWIPSGHINEAYYAAVYDGKEIYQLKGSKLFNALKYVHISCRYKNLVKGDPNAEFLGL